MEITYDLIQYTWDYYRNMEIRDKIVGIIGKLLFANEKIFNIHEFDI